jgi:hypothetical protein
MVLVNATVDMKVEWAHPAGRDMLAMLCRDVVRVLGVEFVVLMIWAMKWRSLVGHF